MIRDIPIGSVLFCKLGPAEHTGVYIGDGKIVELSGNGKIQITNPAGFVAGFPYTTKIYVACDSNVPISRDSIARRAKHLVGHERSYNVFFDNCHQFTAGCITGQYENNNNYFYLLESLISDSLNNGSKVKWHECIILSEAACNSSPIVHADKLYDGSKWLPYVEVRQEEANLNCSYVSALDEKAALAKGWFVLKPPKDYGIVEFELSWWYIKCGQAVSKGTHILDIKLSDLVVPCFSPICGIIKETSMFPVFTPGEAIAFIEPA